MRDRQDRRQKSERPSWQASPFLRLQVRVDPKCSSKLRRKTRAQNSAVLQHLAKLLGGRSDDSDEVGLPKPALDAMALQVAAGSAMKHRRMSGRDTCIAGLQAKRDDAAPVAVVGIERVGCEFHGLRFKIGSQLTEVSRLLREIAIDVAERRGNLIHDRDALSV